jgi:hypothetical protein
MPSPITTLRSTLSSALTNNGVWSVFAYPPQAPLANSVTIMPDEPYIRVLSNTRTAIAPIARFKLLLLIQLFDNQGNLNSMEDFIVAVQTKLAAADLTINVGEYSAPSILEQPSGNLLQTEVSIEIITSWS